MKNLKFLGIIVMVAIIGFTMVGCGEKGGVIEITNNHNRNVTITCSVEQRPSVQKEIAVGATEKWSFDEDVRVSITGGTYLMKVVNLSGGETVKLKIVTGDGDYGSNPIYE